jgi:hypothetical protein
MTEAVGDNEVVVTFEKPEGLQEVVLVVIECSLSTE